MKPIKSFILKTGIVALSLANFGVSAANSGNSEFVKNVDINFPGMAAVVHINNTSANKHVNAINLAVQESKLDFLIHGLVECKSGNAIKFFGAHAYFGPVGIGGLGGLSTTATLHTDTIKVGYDDGDIIEYTEDTFTVPLNKLKNGHPVVRVDPLEELNKKLQSHLQGGGTKADFYKSDQEIVLQRPLSLAGICGNKNKLGDNTVGFETKNHTIQIKYKGDPAITDAPVLNAQLQGGNMPNQIGNILPFKLDKATFQANMPHHFGKCLPDKNPKIRMNFQVSGSEKGLIDLRVKAFSNTYADYGYYFQTTGMVRDPKNGGGYLDFNFPLKEMLSQNKYSYMAISNNKTYNHNMQIQARYKNLEDGSWSDYKDFGTAVFKHRCVPQVVVPLGGNGGKLNYGNDTNPKPMGVRAPAPKPTPKPMSIRAPASEPTPKPMGVRAPATEPTPKPMGVRAPATEPTPKPMTIKAVEPTPPTTLLKRAE